jgi:hypothetical protein
LVALLEGWSRVEGRLPSPVEVAAILEVEGWTAHRRDPALAALLAADASLYAGPWGDALREAARLVG